MSLPRTLSDLTVTILPGRPPPLFVLSPDTFLPRPPMVMPLGIPTTSMADPDFGVSKITRGLFLSGNDFTYEVLRRNGIKYILNISTTVDNPCPGITTLFINIPDGGGPIEKYFPQTYTFIQGALDAGGKVLVHCHMGISRSATIVIAYLMKALNMPYVEVLAMVKAKRPIVDPCLAFTWKLMEYQKELGIPSPLPSPMISPHSS